jgi:hypothetical protein
MWKDIIYHWAPPAIGGVLTIIVGILVRSAEKKRLRDETEARIFREDMRMRVNMIRKQNGWLTRKFIELVSQHNLKHADAHLTMEDYPNGYDDRPDGG